MSAKRWFIMLLCVVIIVLMPIPALNIIVDPFSVFGDSVYDWHSYGMTNNPKTGKFAYIDSLRGQFDAFAVGPSNTSAFTTEFLESHTGLRWYNMFHYGANMDYTARLAIYLIETHRPQQLILFLPTVSAVSFSAHIRGLTTEQPFKPLWRVPFLYADPEYSFNKISAYERRSYVQGRDDVFIAETGEYDKTRRDVEPIGALDEYVSKYPDFLDPGFWNHGMLAIEETTAAVAEIADMCKRYGVELIIVAPPLLAAGIDAYVVEQVQEFYSRIAEISGFWYFITSSVSYEPRYFYDPGHFRNAVGDMMIARIYGGDSTYIPDDFGIWVTEENVHSVIADGFSSKEPPALQLYTKELPVLMYHHLNETGGRGAAISIARFEEHMHALYEAGYTAVSLEQVRDYVLLGHDLPERAVLITFDDGYLSNYRHAFPVLQRYGFHAAIFVIGVSYGKDTYKDTGEGIAARFGDIEALEMVESGLISVQSHSFDMHYVDGYDYDYPFRQGVLQLDDESEEDYIEMFRNDFALMQELLEDIGDVFAFSYPYGRISLISSILLNELGIQVTFSVEPGVNTLVKGLPQSLLELRRNNMTDEITGEDLVKMFS